MARNKCFVAITNRHWFEYGNALYTLFRGTPSRPIDECETGKVLLALHQLGITGIDVSIPQPIRRGLRQTKPGEVAICIDVNKQQLLAKIPAITQSIHS